MRRALLLMSVALLAVAGAALAQQSRVFVTSTATTGNFGGLAGGDQFCADRAAAGGLGGTWVAWLSTSSVDAINRLTASGPYVRAVSGLTIADDVADLTDGSLDAAISDDEFGAPITAEVWTGTGETGLFSGQACADWTDDVPRGDTGDSSAADSEWTSQSSDTCDVPKNLYCFETPAPVPTAPWPGLLVLAILLIGAGAITLTRQRRRELG